MNLVEISQQQQEDPLSLTVKSTFSSMKELQDLAAPAAARVESVAEAAPAVEGSLTDISHSYAAVNLPEEANLPQQSTHVPAEYPPTLIPESPPIEVTIENVETQVKTNKIANEKLDDAQRAAFTQECSSQPLMLQDVHQITPQLYEGNNFTRTFSMYRYYYQTVHP